MKMYCTYVLKSKKDNNFYIGWIDDLQSRFKKHNAGEVASTCNRKPFGLIYYEACLSRRKAIIREKQLKTGYGRKYLSDRI